MEVVDVDLVTAEEGKSAAGKKFVNKQLPVGCERANKWCHVFIPTYVNYVAGYKDPWFVDDDDAINAMQHAWDHIFDSDGIAHVVEVNDTVFSIVSAIYLFHMHTILLTMYRLISASMNGAQHSAPQPLLS